jgi:hypothetical protein
MGIYFEVSKRRYIKNNKKVLEVQIFADESDYYEYMND